MLDIHRAAFKEEAYENLSLLESSLLELEDDPGNSEIIGTVFRYMHTIKGSGAMFGFDDIASFTHEVETVFDLVRSGKIGVTKELINLTLAARDLIREMLDGSESGAKSDREAVDTLTSSFRRMLPEPARVDAVVASKGTTNKGESARDRAYFIRFKPSPGLFMSGTNPVCLFKELADLGKVTITAQTADIPLLEEIDPDLCYTSWDILLVSTCDLNAISDVFMFVGEESEPAIRVLDDEGDDKEQPPLGEILLQRGDITSEDFNKFLGERLKIGEQLISAGLVPASVVESALAQQPQLKQLRKERGNSDQKSSIRVPSERLDSLVNLVGEQVTVQARLSQLALSMKHPALTSIAEEVKRLTGELRESTLKIRMLPIGSTFSNFRRLVRDLSIELGKEVEMTTAGEETELDKTIIEKLNDPLVHMIRNCIDHAIELPELRAAGGKPRQGKIHLAAVHSGDSVYISISDDGAGLDRDAILAKAMEKELVPAGAALSEKEVFALIFAPGFSTAKEVTSVSGRGVGMDVVKQSIEDLRGSVDVKSERGKGTTITVRIPLTLAIIESLLVRLGAAHYLFPLSQVEECVFLTRDDVARAHNRQVVNIRGNIIPYIRLRSRFAVIGSPPPYELLVITDVDGTKVGFVVDSIVGQHQAVIKALGSAYREVDGVSGATILGDGSVALILDVPKLYYTEKEAA